MMTPTPACPAVAGGIDGAGREVFGIADGFDDKPVVLPPENGAAGAQGHAEAAIRLAGRREQPGDRDRRGALYVPLERGVNSGEPSTVDVASRE